MSVKYVHRQSDASADAFPNRSNAAGIMVDSDDNKLKVNPDGTVVEVVDTAHDFTLAGALTLSGAVTLTGAVTATALQLPSTAGPTSGALTAAMSGRLCIGVVNAAWTLPSVTGNAGVWYTLVTGVASAGTGVTVTALTAVIQGKTTPAGTAAITDATTITNTPGTDVVGDYVTLRCDGTNWWMVGMSGIYAETA